MGGSKQKKSTQSDDLPPMISVDDFKTFFLEAFRDPEIRNEMKTILLPSIDEITDRVAAKFDSRLKSLQDSILQRDAKIAELQTEIMELKSKADDNEQYSRRSTVRFLGIPEPKDDQPEEEVKKILNQLEMTPVIQRCHRLGPKPTSNDDTPLDQHPTLRKHRPIICQFTGQKDKLLIMRNWRSIQSAFPGVRVFEDLTRSRATLAYEARKLKKAGRLSNTWTSDGKIIIKDLHGKIHRVRTTDELCEKAPY